MYRVFCLEEEKNYYFDADSPYEAIMKMKRYLDISHRDNKYTIELCNGRTLALTHSGKTYGVIIGR